MKKISVLLLIITVIFIVVPVACYAELDQKAEINSMMDIFINNTESIKESLQDYAKRLFTVLAVIQVLYAMGMLAVRGQIDMQAIATTLLRQIMIIGIFYFLVENGPTIFQLIIDSFRTAATSSGTIPDSIKPGDIFSTGLNLTRNAKDAAWAQTGFFKDLGYGEYVYISILCTIMQLAFAVISVTYMLALIKGYFICTAGMLFLGFGGSEWSSDIAKNTLKSVLSVGAEIFCILLIATIATNAISDWSIQIKNATSGQAISALVGAMGSLAFIVAVLTLTVPSLASGLISGSAIGAGGTAAAGAMAGAAAMAPARMMARAGMSKAGKAMGSLAGKGASKMWEKAKRPVTVGDVLGTAKSGSGGGNSVSP